MKIVTHSGNFHADDVFAVATLLFLHPKAKVERTRDIEKISKADIAVDVGSIYKPEIYRFDHHQPGGAGVRQNGIPYAAFGLVWKEYGRQIAGESIASLIDKKIVSPIDAIDNGVSITEPLFDGVEPYDISAVVSSYLPEEGGKNVDECFMEAVKFAKNLLQREILSAEQEAKDTETLRNLAMRSQGPVLILDKFLRGKDILMDFPGILFVVFPGREEWGDSKWYLKTVRKSKTGFESKKLLPVGWAGKNDLELAKETGVSDAAFCHKGRFLAAAWSKNGAVELAKKALEA